MTRERRPPHFEVIVADGAANRDTIRKTLPWHEPRARRRAAKPRWRERILIIDGAMGTMIQRHELDEADYRGERFADGYDALVRRDGHAHGDGCGCDGATSAATTTC